MILYHGSNLDIESKLCNLDCKYDIVTGPVANDDLAMLLREYQNHARYEIQG